MLPNTHSKNRAYITHKNRGLTWNVFELTALKLFLEKKWHTDFSLYSTAHFLGIGMHYCQVYQVL